MSPIAPATFQVLAAGRWLSQCTMGVEDVPVTAKFCWKALLQTAPGTLARVLHMRAFRAPPKPGKTWTRSRGLIIIYF